MAKRSPPPLSNAAIRARENRIARIAEQLGFVGSVEYRHVYSRSGGAQYGQAKSPEGDRLIVYAEAFDRDTNPDEFSLDAMLAHERGHQVLVRHPRIGRLTAGRISSESEEILASIVGALLCSRKVDQENLLTKAAVELLAHGEDVELVDMKIQKLYEQLGAML